METGATRASDFAQGEVDWVTVEDCAACNKYEHFSDYTYGNEPDNFDWRDLGAVTDIKNQAYCGSCWSFSTAADLEGTTYLRTGELTSLSNQQLVTCSTVNYGCDGGYPFLAMQYVEHVGGLVTWDELPYEALCMDNACGGVDVYVGPPICDTSLINTEVESGNVASLTGWQMVAMGAEYEDLMRIAMLKNGPISIAFNAVGMDYYVHGVVGCSSTMECDAGAIDHHTPCDPTMLDHAVLIVGYGVQTTSAYDLAMKRNGDGGDDNGGDDNGGDDDDNGGDDDGDGIAYWVIKNSWGSDWGESGYYRILRGENHCGVANFAVHSVLTEPN
jgi:C1A family cysteine protease